MFFLLTFPTLHWIEFSNGAEGLNVATALEIHRTGAWLNPTLNGEVRLAKPPLTTWITAAAIRPDSLRRIDSTDRAVRHRGYDELARQVRWPALLAASVALYLTFELGRLLLGGDGRAGLVALIVAGSAFLWLRFAHYATADILLMVWVVAANVAIASAVLCGRWWSGCALAGVALGLAMLTKGPVSVVETALPAGLFVAWRAGIARRGADGFDGANVRRHPVLPLLLGAALLVAVAAPWFVVTAKRNPSAWQRWLVEVTREGATTQRPDKWYSYLGFPAFLVPWVIFFIVGLVLAYRRVRARGADGVVYAAFLLVGPVLVMALFRDRQIRYLVPMLPAAAVLTTAALREWRAADARDALIRWIARLHWATVLALAVGFPLAASLVLEQGRGDGRSEKWLPLPLGLGAAAAGAALVVAGARLTRGGVPGAGLVPVTACVMLALQPLFIFGYRRSDDGRADMRPLADLIVSNYPSAHVFALNKFARPDMNIYLDRPVPRFDGAHDLTDPQPDILLVFDDEDPGQPAPPGTTAEWTLVGTAPRGRDRWLAYLHDDR